MTDLQALREISRLLRLDVQATDRALCAMPAAHLHVIAGQMGMTLPTHGGDKPLLVGAALERRRWNRR